MEYITGANKFLLTRQEISTLKDKATKSCDAGAAYRLFEHFQYAEFDEKEAVKWIERSAECGNPIAQYNLALRYLNEIKTPYIPFDIERAKDLLKQAANGRVDEAKELLIEIENKESKKATGINPGSSP